MKNYYPSSILDTIPLDTNSDDQFTSYFLHFGYEREFFTGNFQDELNTINKFDFNKPCDLISIGFVGRLAMVRGPVYPGIMTFSYMIPRRITIKDSTNESIHGCNFVFPLTGFYFIKRDRFQTAMCAGLEVGRMKLIDEVNRKMKNGMFGPFGGIIMEGWTRYFSLFATGQYCYDITTTRWKPTWISHNQETEIPKFRQSAYKVTLGINFYIFTSPPLFFSY